MRTTFVFLIVVILIILLFLGVPTLWGFVQNQTQVAFASCEPVTLRDSVRERSLTLSVRAKENERIEESVASWIKHNSENIARLAVQGGDILVFVHGLDADMENALCAGRALWAELDREAPNLGTGLLIFDWPSVFGANFGMAQNMADDVAPYLKAVLEELPPGRTLVAAHSLGAQVLLSAAGGLNGKPRKGLLLIQGAIPAAAIMHYNGTRKTYTPKSNEPTALRRCDYPGASSELIVGRGGYAPAILMFKRVVITQTNKDYVLRNIYTTDEIIDSRNYGIPMLSPDYRKGVRDQPKLQPVGAVWSTPFEHYYDSGTLDVVSELLERGENDEFDAIVPLRDLAPARCDSVTFKLDHPDAVLLEIDSHRKDWKPVVWHSPHFHQDLRAVMVDALIGRPNQ